MFSRCKTIAELRSLCAGICGLVVVFADLVCMVKNQVLKNRVSKNRASKNRVLKIRAPRNRLVGVEPPNVEYPRFEFRRIESSRIESLTMYREGGKDNKSWCGRHLSNQKQAGGTRSLLDIQRSNPAPPVCTR